MRFIMGTMMHTILCPRLVEDAMINCFESYTLMQNVCLFYKETSVFFLEYYTVCFLRKS